MTGPPARSERRGLLPAAQEGLRVERGSTSVRDIEMRGRMAGSTAQGEARLLRSPGARRPTVKPLDGCVNRGLVSARGSEGCIRKKRYEIEAFAAPSLVTFVCASDSACAEPAGGAGASSARPEALEYRVCGRLRWSTAFATRATPANVPDRRRALRLRLRGRSSWLPRQPAKRCCGPVPSPDRACPHLAPRC